MGRKAQEGLYVLFTQHLWVGVLQATATTTQQADDDKPRTASRSKSFGIVITVCTSTAIKSTTVPTVSI